MERGAGESNINRVYSLFGCLIGSGEPSTHGMCGLEILLKKPVMR